MNTIENTTRQKTRVIAVVHSHIQNPPENGVIDLSRDLVEINISKNIKGIGTASITLVPRKDYLNYVFANDVVNIYIDPGDGERGFIRTFFGYVDRIDRSSAITNSESGARTTMFTLTCSDFSKAIERTEIYFNPALARHPEFVDSRFTATNLGGISLLSRGIVVHGTPADVVENLLNLLFGFGSQWVLPDSYYRGFKEDARKKRLQRAKAHVSKNLKNELKTNAFIDIDSQAPGADLYEQLSSASTNNTSDFNVRDDLAKIYETNSELLAFATILKEANSDIKASILDLLEFSFIENLCIDGYISDSGIWQASGSLMSLLKSHSNEIVNELIFDLRPVTDGVDATFGSGTGSPALNYSTDPDETGINTFGSYAILDNTDKDQSLVSLPATVGAVQYRPAVVLREYPFSTVSSLDLSKYSLDQIVKYHLVPFGPIFNQGLNLTGRHYYNYGDIGLRSISPVPDLYSTDARPLKHIDVVAISDKDVISDRVGRSDSDTFNLFALYSTSPLQEFWKYILQDLMPVATPVSIKRHGLRTFLPSTEFANYTRNPSGQSGIDGQEEKVSLIRWALLLDHWNQHNIEYLNGTITLRGMPEIRVGYRLDWLERRESYYVEQVDHSWRYGETALTTIVQVSRGQRNDPMPAYIPPMNVVDNTPDVVVNAVNNKETLTVGKHEIQRQMGGNRTDTGRLAQFFKVLELPATQKATTGELNSEPENVIDLPPNASGNQTAVYVGIGQDIIEVQTTPEERLETLIEKKKGTISKEFNGQDPDL